MTTPATSLVQSQALNGPQPWSFDATAGLDRPFHGLVTLFGNVIIEDLDNIVLDTPLKAAMRATKVFQHYSAQVGRDGETREVMSTFATVMKSNVNILDDDALLTPEAVFHGLRG